MTEPPDLVCTGRPVRRYSNSPQGEPCNTRYPYRASPEGIESARVAGWRVGPAGPGGARPAMCPDCARPGDAETPGQADILEPTLPGL